MPHQAQQSFLGVPEDGTRLELMHVFDPLVKTLAVFCDHENIKSASLVQEGKTYAMNKQERNGEVFFCKIFPEEEQSESRVEIHLLLEKPEPFERNFMFITETLTKCWCCSQNQENKQGN